MSPTLEALYAERGRPSIAPEVLLCTQFIQILYAIPSERRLCEHLESPKRSTTLRRPRCGGIPGSRRRSRWPDSCPHPGTARVLAFRTTVCWSLSGLSLIHISEPTRL